MMHGKHVMKNGKKKSKKMAPKGRRKAGARRGK